MRTLPSRCEDSVPSGGEPVSLPRGFVASFSSLDFGPFETEYGPDEVRVPITVRETVGLAIDRPTGKSAATGLPLAAVREPAFPRHPQATSEAGVWVPTRETVGVARPIGRHGGRPLRDCRWRQSVNSRPDGIRKRRAKREDREERDAGRPWELRDPSAGTEAGRYGTAARGSP